MFALLILLQRAVSYIHVAVCSQGHAGGKTAANNSQCIKINIQTIKLIINYNQQDFESSTAHTTQIRSINNNYFFFFVDVY